MGSQRVRHDLATKTHTQAVMRYLGSMTCYIDKTLNEISVKCLVNFNPTVVL